MSGIGIDLKVNSRQVMDAKQQIEMLNRSLNDTNALGDLTIGEDGLPLASQRIKEMSEQVRRLQALSRQGTSKGGVLDQKQFQEAQEHMKRLNGYIQDYAKNITRVKTEMQQLSAAQANLARTGQRGSDEFKSNRNRMAELQEERRNLEAQERHVRQYGAQGSSAAGDIANMNQQQQAAQGMNLKKILGYGLAAAGGFSILGFLSQSRAKYQQSVGHEVTLGARGIKDGFNDNVNMGIGPLEQMQMLEHLSSSTGMSGQKAKDAAKMSGAFGRYAGVDPNQVAGMYGTMYQTTGKEDSANAIINLMGDAIKKGMDKAKTTELLTMVTRNTQLTAQAMGGAGIDDKQAMMATSMALEAIKAGQEGKGYSQFAKSAEMQNFMQNGMEFNGDPTGDIIKAQILGLDSSEMSWAKKQKIDELQKGGFTSDKGMLDRMMGVVKEATAFEGNSLEAQAGFIGNKIDPRLRGKPSRMLVEMYNDKDKDGKNVFDRADSASKGGAKLNEVDRKKIEEWEAASGSKALSRMALGASKEQAEIETGDKLDLMFGKIEAGLVNSFNKVMDGDIKGAFSALEKEIGAAGIALGGLTLGAGALSAAGPSLIASSVALDGSAAALALAATRMGGGGVIPPKAPLPIMAGATPLIAPAVIGTAGAAGVWAARSINEQQAKGMSSESIRAMLNGTDRKTVMGGGIDKTSRAMLEQELASRGETAGSGYKFPKQEGLNLPDFDAKGQPMAASDFSSAARSQNGQHAVKLLGRSGGVTRLLMNDGTVQERKGDMNWANHNYGNLMADSKIARDFGSIGSTPSSNGPATAVFKDEATGKAALREWLFGENSSYRKRNLMETAKKYQTGDPNKWASHVHSGAQVDPSKKLSDYTIDEQNRTIEAIATKAEGNGKGEVRVLEGVNLQRVLEKLEKKLDDMTPRQSVIQAAAPSTR